MNGRYQAGLSRRDFLRSIGYFAGSSGVIFLSGVAACQKSSQSSSGATVSNGASTAAVVQFTSTPQELRFSPEYIWVKDEGGGMVWLGITQKLFNMLTNKGKVRFNSLAIPDPGEEIFKGQVIGSIESDKMTIDLITPVSGEVRQTSDKIMVNNNVYSAAWLLQMKLSHPEEMDSMLAYEEYLEMIGQDYEY